MVKFKACKVSHFDAISYDGESKRTNLDTSIDKCYVSNYLFKTAC